MDRSMSPILVRKSLSMRASYLKGSLSRSNFSFSSSECTKSQGPSSIFVFTNISDDDHMIIQILNRRAIESSYRILGSLEENNGDIMTKRIAKNVSEQTHHGSRHRKGETCKLCHRDSHWSHPQLYPCCDWPPWVYPVGLSVNPFQTSGFLWIVCSSFSLRDTIALYSDMYWQGRQLWEIFLWCKLFERTLSEEWL